MRCSCSAQNHGVLGHRSWAVEDSCCPCPSRVAGWALPTSSASPLLRRSRSSTACDSGDQKVTAAGGTCRLVPLLQVPARRWQRFAQGPIGRSWSRDRLLPFLALQPGAALWLLSTLGFLSIVWVFPAGEGGFQLLLGSTGAGSGNARGLSWVQRKEQLEATAGLMLVKPDCYRGRRAQAERSDSPRITPSCPGPPIASGALAARTRGTL